MIAALVLKCDECVKSFARFRLILCIGSIADCDRVELIGPLWLVRTANAGSAFGFRQGWWIWVALEACGVLLVPVYGRWLGVATWAAATCSSAPSMTSTD